MNYTRTAFLTGLLGSERDVGASSGCKTQRSPSGVNIQVFLSSQLCGFKLGCSLVPLALRGFTEGSILLTAVNTAARCAVVFRCFCCCPSREGDSFHGSIQELCRVMLPPGLTLLQTFKIDQGRKLHVFIALSPLERLLGSRVLFYTKHFELASHCHRLLLVTSSRYLSPDRRHLDLSVCP